MKMKNWPLVLLLAGCAAKAPTPPPAAATAAPFVTEINSLEQAVNSPYRTAANKERDVYRHPLETLTFFGLQPEMTVIEITPGRGWYTEILAPYLAPHGHYIGAATSAGDATKNADLRAWMQSHPSIAAKMQLVEFSADVHPQLGPDNSVDAVLTFRNYHNWISKKADKKALQAFFKVLKPGGIFGIVEHRASNKKKQDPLAVSGYMREDYVIREAQRAGFKLVAKSELNANPKDSKDYTEGVWTLPPSYELGETDKAKYAAIGESDRMTLKFIKPANGKKNN